MGQGDGPVVQSRYLGSFFLSPSAARVWKRSPKLCFVNVCILVTMCPV